MIRGMSALILLIVLCSALVLFTEICVVFAGETVYIRADGSVEGTDKIQRDGNVYTLTGDISDPLVVERDNIVVDGAGHVLEGTGAGRGIFLEGRSNITIKYIGWHLPSFPFRQQQCVCKQHSKQPIRHLPHWRFKQ